MEMMRYTAELTLAWVGLIAVAGLLAALAYPLLRSFSTGASPARRANTLLVFGLLPVFAGTLVMAFLMKPELGDWLFWTHCHEQVCGPHSPLINSGGWTAGFAIAAFSALLICACLFTFYIVHRQYYRGQLLQTVAARPTVQQDWRIIPSNELAAFCAGFLRPRLYVSQGLIDQLPPAELQAVIAHEQAHAERYDNLRKIALYTATLFWPRRARMLINKDHDLACESACDHAAVILVDPRNLTAALEKLDGYAAAGNQDAHAPATTLADLRRRALLHEGQAEAIPYGWILIGGIWLLMIPLLVRFAHSLLEWLLA